MYPDSDNSAAEADGRWRDWLAKGAASNRRSAARMSRVLQIIVAAMLIGFLVYFA